ncbi:MAG: hypothetical protein NC452_18765 [Eubacterium sp.]|nr:hypothetical protein [Eubacterium sp.]
MGNGYLTALWFELSECYPKGKQDKLLLDRIYVDLDGIVYKEITALQAFKTTTSFPLLPV